MSVWLATLTAINRRKSAVSFCVDPEGATAANVCMAGCPFWYQSGKTLTQVCPIFNPPANSWQKTWCSLMSTLQIQQSAWLQTNLTTTNNQLTTYGSSTCVSQHPKLRLDDFLAVTATSAFRSRKRDYSSHHLCTITPSPHHQNKDIATVHSTRTNARAHARTHTHTHTRLLTLLVPFCNIWHLTFLRCIVLLYFAIRLESRKSVNKRIYLSI